MRHPHGCLEYSAIGEKVAYTRQPAEHDNQFTRWRIEHALYREKTRQRHIVRQFNLIISPVPAESECPRRRGEHLINEDVVLDPIVAICSPLTAEKKYGIERVSVVAGKVVLDRPIEVFQIRSLSSPFQMMAQLVSEGIPRLLVPVEVLLYASKRRKRPVIQHKPALNTVSPATYFHLERNALAKSVDVTPLGVWNTPRRHHDFRDPFKKLRRNPSTETANHAL